MPTIEVTLTWRGTPPLPPGARLVVTVADVARAGAPARVLAETTIDDPPPPPIRIELPIGGRALDPRARYSARARVLVDGELRMISDMDHPVLRNADDRQVDVFLRALPDAGPRPTAPPDATLANTYWRLTRLGTEALAADDVRREPALVLRDVDGRRGWSGTVGCNRLVGRFEVSGDAIRFSGGASTRMACPPPFEDRERDLLEALERTTTFRIEGDRLRLLDGAGAPLVEAVAVYLD